MDQQEQNPLKRFCLFGERSSRWLGIFFRPGPMHYLVHLERLTGIEVAWFRYIWAIDDFDAILNYKGYELRLWMDWDGDIALMSTETVPPEIFGEVCAHLRQYRWVSGMSVAKYQKRYRKPAKVTWYEK